MDGNMLRLACANTYCALSWTLPQTQMKETDDFNYTWEFPIYASSYFYLTAVQRQILYFLNDYIYLTT